MHAPIGLSGVQTVAKMRQSVGCFRPRRIDGHSQALLSALGHLA